MSSRAIGPFTIDGWVSEGVKSNIGTATKLADTGPLDGPASHRFLIFASSTVATSIAFERRAIDGSILKTQRLDVLANTPLSLPISLPIYADDKESFTISCSSLVTGSIQASLFFD